MTSPGPALANHDPTVYPVEGHMFMHRAIFLLMGLTLSCTETDPDAAGAGGSNAAGSPGAQAGAATSGGTSGNAGGAPGAGGVSNGGETGGGAASSGGSPTAEGGSGGSGAFEPCEGLACGAACNNCPPGVVCVVGPGFCQQDGGCAPVEAQCDDPPYDPCADKADGEPCTLCDPNATDCVETAVVKQCQAGECEAAMGAGMCSAQGQSCAAGEECCAGLTCCSGVPVQQGEEFCGNLCPISDQNMKQDFASVDPEAILAKVMQLPISAWSYKAEPDKRHVGPMAQDFMATFGVGSSERTILQVDADGVALAAIQALARRVEQLAAQNQQLLREIQRLEAQAAAQPVGLTNLSTKRSLRPR